MNLDRPRAVLPWWNSEIHFGGLETLTSTWWKFFLGWENLIIPASDIYYVSLVAYIRYRYMPELQLAAGRRQVAPTFLINDIQ